MKETNGPFFSVILPTHNGEACIGKALESIRTQTFRDFELIVVCDACKDNTRSFVEQTLQNEEFPLIILEENLHRDGLARNVGLDHASGDWILFIDDDDWFLHEYCLQELADKIRNDVPDDTDTVDFSFIWKGRGYFTQSVKMCHSMVWSRAWKRSFIGDKRFDDQDYGSDSNFFDKYVRNNPDCRIFFWNFPMYYYNYMREGSMSWMKNQVKSAKIDIVITHYNEPWEVGKKLFDSIAMQECFRFEDVNIILVQDGEDNALRWGELLSQYPFLVNIATIKHHQGVAIARNVGLEHTVTDWVLFMDFDDMFADIASLAMITRIFPVSEDTDIIWCKYIREVNDYGRYKYTTFNCEDEHDYRMIGKLYRVSFLKIKNIRFPAQYPEYCDMIFNSLVFAETYAFRIKSFYAPFYPFFKKLRRDGAFSTMATLDAKVRNQFGRNVLLMEEMRKRRKIPQYNALLVRVIADVYHTIRHSELEPDERKGITDDLIAFWKQHREEFLALSPNDVEVALDESQTEAMTFIQEYYNYYDKEYYLQNDMISFEDFVKYLDSVAAASTAETEGGKAEPSEPVPETTEPAPEPDNLVSMPVSGDHRNDRVVVYCGTKETYINMLASVKSLLATTPVHKVYFLIEDDSFPYDLPDIIETWNVKNIGLFDENGPNFKNVWTYMCLMRTAYPQMFPQYDKVLSLDVDIVITEDVSDLWDIDLTDYCFAGVPEEGRVPDGSADFYANFGVIMMNLDKLRRDGIGPQLVEAVNTEHFGCPEQDAFNKLCKGHIYRLPNDYNVTVYSHITGEPLRERILHYAGLKYWKHFGPVKKYYNMTWPDIMKLQEMAHNG